MAETFTVPLQGGNQIDCISRIEAAKRLGISTRTLDRRTAPNGPIKPFRLGRRVLFPVSELDRYIAGHAAADQNGGDQ